MIVFGNISLNPKGFVNTSKEEFMNLFKGKTTQDLNKIWVAIQEANLNVLWDEFNLDYKEPKEVEETESEEQSPFCMMDKSEKKKTKKK